MADVKKFYWLKLPQDFFKQHDIRIIEGMPSGKEIILFYMKLLAESISHNGKLRFSDIVPYDNKKLAIVTNTKEKIVENSMQILQELKMLEVENDGTIYLPEISKMIGYESEWANKKRQYRDNARTIEGQKRTMSDKSKSKSKSKNIKEEEEGQKSTVKCYEYFQQNIGLLGGAILQEINSFLDDGIMDELICHVVDLAVKANARSWNYISKVLRDCVQGGVKTVEQFKLKQAEHTERKGQTQSKPANMDKYKAPKFERGEQ